MKTPGSTRELRRTYDRLQQEGHVDKEAAVLLRAGKKLATDNKLLRLENDGLRKAVIGQKKKRKRGKAMNFYDEGEKEGQALFFGPAKVARVRARNAAIEEAEQQRKRDVDDRKLQSAITGAEKAREAEEKKNQRVSQISLPFSSADRGKGESPTS